MSTSFPSYVRPEALISKSTKVWSISRKSTPITISCTVPIYLLVFNASEYSILQWALEARLWHSYELPKRLNTMPFLFIVVRNIRIMTRSKLLSRASDLNATPMVIKKQYTAAPLASVSDDHGLPLSLANSLVSEASWHVATT